MERNGEGGTHFFDIGHIGLVKMYIPESITASVYFLKNQFAKREKKNWSKQIISVSWEIHIAQH